MIINDRHGLQTVGHDGNTIGFTTLNDFFPQHNLGIVVLTNGQGTNQFSALVKRKLLEVAFPDIKAKVEELLTYSIKNTSDAIKNVVDKVTAPPPDAYITPLLGVYTNPSLGSLTLSKRGEDVIADAGEWQTKVGLDKDTGTELLMTLESPLAGLSLRATAPGKLLLDFGQQKYTFIKQ